MSQGIWCGIIGALIIVWIGIGLKSLNKLNTVAMASLLVLTAVLSSSLVGQGMMELPEADNLSFGLALELSVAMPLSWLPLISDYTREAGNPVKATAVSVLVYGLVSSWMYAIGLGTALVFDESDIAQVMLKSGLGMAGLLIIVFSTVTTTFLDAYSAGVSSESLSGQIKGKPIAITVTLLGTIGAMLLPLLDFTEFLYFIGSVFAPMAALQLADYFVLGKRQVQDRFCWQNLLLWLLGFAIYRLLIQLDLPIGSTLPDMLITMALGIALGFWQKQHKSIAVSPK